MKIYVKKWIHYGTASNFPEAPCGGLGGWFNFNERGQRWKDYKEAFKKITHPYIEAIRKSVIDNHLKITGQEHQYSDHGVPLFSDGRASTFSYRAWGDIMAAIWSEEENKDYSYMDFYM